MKNRYLLLLLLLLFAGCEGDKAKLIKQNDEKTQRN